MFNTIGLPELLVLLVIVLLVFGVGRIGKIAGELGAGIRAFKEGLSGENEKKKNVKEENLDGLSDEESE